MLRGIVPHLTKMLNGENIGPSSLKESLQNGEYPIDKSVDLNIV